MKKTYQIGGNHYSILKYDPWWLIRHSRCNFFQGSVIKYVTRYKNKNGLQDLQKALSVIDYMKDNKVYKYTFWYNRYVKKYVEKTTCPAIKKLPSVPF